MIKLTSFDPGHVTGVAFGYYEDDTPYRLTSAHILTFAELSEMFWNGDLYDTTDTVVVERFDLNMGNEFKADLEGVQVEGMLRHVYADKIVWQPRSAKASVRDEVLKRMGLWQTGSDVCHEDGRDANDAIIHALAYLKNTVGHVPTIRAMYPRNMNREDTRATSR